MITLFRRRVLVRQYVALYGHTVHFAKFATAVVKHGARYLEQARNNRGQLVCVSLLDASGRFVGVVSPSGEVSVRGVDFRVDLTGWRWLESA